MEPCSRTPGPNCLLYERGWAANEANDKNSTPQSNSVLRRRERPKNAAVRACVRACVRAAIVYEEDNYVGAGVFRGSM